MDVIPLFKSHYSLGRSILTLENKTSEDTGPDSIIEICKNNRLKNLFLVEDNMSSFLEAYTNCRLNNINLCYGLRITITDSYENKTEESMQKNAKYIIFAKNNYGYNKLIKIYSLASKEGFYHYPRIDLTFLKSIWNEEDLMLCVPFYDSFIFNNFLRNYICIPTIDFTKPKLFVENNNLIFDNFLLEKAKKYAEDNGLEIIKTKSIYYKNRKDFKTYLTFRCINKRTTLNKPELEHLSSEEFCFESWNDLNNHNRHG